MPAITSIRIVNFSYNNRLIPDEIFSLSDEARNPINALINLENGGGKSVIIQTIMQAIIPKATIQGRTIKEYFQKPTNHAFILIEWKLDNSTDRLLCGIAIRSNVGNDEKNDIRYYTFLKTYGLYGDKNDIVNMNLSTIENNMFKVLGHEVVKTNLKNAKFEIYSDNDTSSYKRELDTYGISALEWENVIADINNTESGIDKYLEKHKTSNSLVDNLIIKTITNSLGKQLSDKADSTLGDMIYAFASRYSESSEKAILRENMKNYSKAIDIELEILTDIHKNEDARNDAVRKLWNFRYTLNKENEKIIIEKGVLNDTLTSIKNQIQYVNLEKLSSEYHKYNDKVILLEEFLQQNNTQICSINQSLLENIENKRIQCASKIYIEQEAYANEAISLRLSIVAAELDIPNNEALNKAKYSLYKKSVDENFVQTEINKNATESFRKNENEKIQLSSKITQLKSGLKEFEVTFNQLEGSNTEKRKNIERSFDELGVSIGCTLDKRFVDTDIAEEKANFKRDITNAYSNYEKTIKIIKQLSLEIEKRRLLNQNLLNSIKDIQYELKTQEILKNEYLRQENALEQIYNRENVDLSLRFNDRMLEILNDNLMQNSSKIKISEKELSVLEEQKCACDSGTLHVNKNIISFLDEKNLEYQTGEKYLLGIASENANSKEFLLERYPFIVYSIITNDKEKIDKASESLWFSSILPIITRDDINAMLKGDFLSTDSLISKYSNTYFNNADKFTSTLVLKIDVQMQDIKNLKNISAEVKQDITIVQAFNYTKDFIINLEKKILTLTSEIKVNEATIIENEKFIKDSKEESENLDDRSNSCKEYILKTEEKSNRFTNLAVQIDEYYQCLSELSVCKRTCDELTLTLAQSEINIKNVKENIEEANTILLSSKEIIQKTEEYIVSLKNSAQTEIITESLEVLILHYEELDKSANSDMKVLKEKLNNCIINLNKCKENLEEFSEFKDRYINIVFSKAKLKEFIKEEKRLIVEDKNANNSQNKANGELNARKSTLKEKLDSIHEINMMPLEKNKISMNLKEELIQLESDMKLSAKNLVIISERIEKISFIIRDCDTNLKGYEQMNSFNEISICEDLEDVLGELISNILECKKALRLQSAKLKIFIETEINIFKGKGALFEKAIYDHSRTLGNIDNLEFLIYYDLNRRLEAHKDLLAKRIAQINIDLEDIDSSKEQIINQMVEHGKTIYKEIDSFCKSSRVKLTHKTVEMIRINLGKDIDNYMARKRILSLFENSLVPIIEAMGIGEDEAAKKIKNLLSDRKMLNAYCNIESIVVDIYKVDFTSENSGYKRWEVALKSNSGGEKFVAFLSIILSVMNYSRSNFGISSKNNSGVLILDNPFGPISSAHLLQPMFSLAHSTNIQLICFSDHDKPEIIRCFNIVYKIKINKLELSSKEILEVKLKNGIESAYFKREQLTLY